ncbi:hypothetical protein [Streptomyces sp. NPDC002215]|uniref:hypothetical protein n=1 Tax=Streptomyces sp. NPDC002215 TaxID=3154412 RepID=UPI00332F76D3
MNSAVQAFAKLPDQVTVAESATATGRTESGVKNWIDTYDDFPSAEDRRDRLHLRRRDQVLNWLQHHPNLVNEDRRGSRNLAQRARAARPSAEYLTVSETAEALGVTMASIQCYAASAKPQFSRDPFPPATRRGELSLRSWPAVRSWIPRRDEPLPSRVMPWQELRPWLLAVYDEEKDDPSPGCDERGLTYAQRDVLERTRVATAQGHAVPDRWTVEMFGAGSLDDAETADGVRAAADRIPPSELAAGLGITIGSLRGYARRPPAG